MIRFPCTSQIRCVNIIENISLCSADFQQVPARILVLGKDNKLTLISSRKVLLSPLCKQVREALLAFPRGKWSVGRGGSRPGPGLAVLCYLVWL